MYPGEDIAIQPGKGFIGRGFIRQNAPTDNAANKDTISDVYLRIRTGSSARNEGFWQF